MSSYKIHSLYCEIINHREAVMDPLNTFRQCILISNLYIIIRLLRNNIINNTQLEELLEKNCLCIRSPIIANYLLEHGMDYYSDGTLNLFLRLFIENDWHRDKIILLMDHNAKFTNDIEINNKNMAVFDFILENKINNLDKESLTIVLKHYVINKWSANTIILLINYGATLPDNINDLIHLPNDIFFSHIDTVNHVIDDKIILNCITNGENKKIEYFCDNNTFSDLEYYNFCDTSMIFDNLVLFNYFIKYVEHDQNIILALILRSDLDYKNHDVMRDILFTKLELTDKKLLLLLLTTYYMEKKLIEAANSLSQILDPHLQELSAPSKVEP